MMLSPHLDAAALLNHRRGVVFMLLHSLVSVPMLADARTMRRPYADRRSWKCGVDCLDRGIRAKRR